MKRQLILSYPHTKGDKQGYYRVEKAINTIQYAPLTLLNPAIVADMCELQTHKITIIPHTLKDSQ